MNKFKITIDGKNYEVTVNETDQNTAKVEVNGNSYSVRYAKEEIAASPVAHTANAPVNAPAAPQTSASQPAGGYSIKAPLPGTILTINAKVGAHIKRGDTLVVMEAMKMENNIMANKDGQIKAIHITVGQTVAQDDLLIDLE